MSEEFNTECASALTVRLSKLGWVPMVAYRIMIRDGNCGEAIENSGELDNRSRRAEIGRADTLVLRLLRARPLLVFGDSGQAMARRGAGPVPLPALPQSYYGDRYLSPYFRLPSASPGSDVATAKRMSPVDVASTRSPNPEPSSNGLPAALRDWRLASARGVMVSRPSTRSHTPRRAAALYGHRVHPAQPRGCSNGLISRFRGDI